MEDVPEGDGLEPFSKAMLLVRFAGLVLDLGAFTLARESGEAIPLTRGELAILRVFVTHPGRVISRDTLLDGVSNRRFEPFDRSVDVMVGKLRRKIEPNPSRPTYHCHGAGHRLQICRRNAEGNRSHRAQSRVRQSCKRRSRAKREC